MNWNKWEVGLPAPAEGTLIDVITASGMQETYRYSKGLLWLTDGSMYAYIQPVFWRAAARGEG